MRLGDLDAMATIESEAYMSAQIKLDNPITQGLNSVVHRKIQQLIADTPTIDAVPVVRCWECKHYHAGTGWCDQLSYFQTPNGEPCSPAESMEWKMFQENDFCSMGQRKIETVLPKSDTKDESLEADHETREPL